MSVGHAHGIPQHAPDMRKDASDVTEEEKRTAKRRIQGNVTGEESPDDSGGDDVPPAPLPPAASA